MESLAIYVHIPYCVRKCAYCDFNAYSGAQPSQVEAYVKSVCREIDSSPLFGRRVETVFFGGGTPTYLTGEQIAAILGRIRSRFQVAEDAEISAEANPSTVDAERFAQMRAAGFNRLSIGVQSFDNRILAELDRNHSSQEARDAIGAARFAGFDNLSIDLMFGLPGQALADWASSLSEALELDLPHVSTYALTLEPGTRFERLHAGGKLMLPSEEHELAMFESAIRRLTEAGYEHYEVSNFARPGFRSRHNVVYWRNEEYAGFGPGAVSFVDGRRWTNERNPTLYARRVHAGADLAVESEALEPAAALAETLIQGLRLRDGIDTRSLKTRFGIDPSDYFAEQFRRLTESGMIERVNGHIRLTHRGLLFANDVALELLP